MKLPALPFLSLALCAAASLHAQTTTWNNGGDGISWADPLNWSTGIPTASTEAIIGVRPSADNGTLGINTGLETNTVNGLTFSAGLSGSVTVVPLTVERFTSTGSITNQSSLLHSFQLPVLAGANLTLAGGTGGIGFSAFTVGNREVVTSGAISITSTIVFDITSAASYGTIGNVSATGATINIFGSYTGQPGDTFDLTTGSFAGATLGALPTLTSGLSWNTSQFLTNGTLTVVPEPTSVGLIASALLFSLVFLRRRLLGARSA